MRTGAPFQLEIVPGAFHAFDIALPWLAVSKRFFEQQCRAIERAFER
jgi:hypothetical protein